MSEFLFLVRPTRRAKGALDRELSVCQAASVLVFGPGAGGVAGATEDAAVEAEAGKVDGGGEAAKEKEATKEVRQRLRSLTAKKTFCVPLFAFSCPSAPPTAAENPLAPFPQIKSGCTLYFLVVYSYDMNEFQFSDF